MDVKLNSNGADANLLTYLNRDFRMKSKDYMREINVKNRKNLKNHIKDHLMDRVNTIKEEFITLQYKPLHHSNIITIE